MGKGMGKRIPLYDAPNHVSGLTEYADDISFRGMLHVKTASIPVPHAKIISVDVSEAEKIDGVHGIITHEDVPNNYWGSFVQDTPILADKYVRFLEQPVVAVAAETELIAYEAAKKVKIEYEELPAVFDAEEAMIPGAIEVHEGGNIEKYADKEAMVIRLGDVEKGFEEADYIMEDKFVTPTIEHAFIEPHCSVAKPENDDSLEIYTSSQTSSWHQMLIGGMLKMPLSKLRIVGMTLGGGFGGKSNPSTEPIVAVLAMKTGRPVKWRWTRREEFLISTIRSADTMWFKTGYKKDGTIVARKIKYIQDTGAYNDFGTYGMLKLTSQINGPYRIPNVWFDGYVVYTNKQVSGPMRGYSITQSAYANETQMDKIAEKLGMDPVEVRRKNLVEDGDILPTQQILECVGAKDTLETTVQEYNWFSKEF
jgi:CO/xanthine dehydrogenase Mo-binding subunit